MTRYDPPIFEITDRWSPSMSPDFRSGTAQGFMAAMWFARFAPEYFAALMQQTEARYLEIRGWDLAPEEALVRRIVAELPLERREVGV